MYPTTRHTRDSLQFDVACQAADALAHLHAMSILHRNISPDNIMRSQSGVIKLADFGMSHTRKDNDDESACLISIRRRNNLVYQAPELVEGVTERVTERVDVWALAATLLETWSGEPPYRQQTDEEIVRLHTYAMLPALDFAERPLPKRIHKLLALCLQFHAHERPSAAALHKELLLARAEMRPRANACVEEALASTHPQAPEVSTGDDRQPAAAQVSATNKH